MFDIYTRIQLSQAGSAGGGGGGGGSITAVNSGTNITVNTVGTVATVNLDDIVNLTHADDGSTQGQLQFNAIPFLHNYGFANTFVGENAGNLTLTPGVGGAISNTALGRDALSAITTGHANTAIGSGSLNAQTSGGSCTVVGNGAASAATNLLNSEVIGINAFNSYNAVSPYTEHNMIVIGTGAGQSMTSGVRSVWIGTRAGGTTLTSAGEYNTCIGYQVSYQPASMGNNNVIIGANSIFGNTLYGNNNVVIGSNAAEGLYGATIGDNNVIIGYGSGTALDLNTTGSNILIANAGLNGESNTIRIGTSGTHNATYISGIAGIPVSNTNMVTIDTTTGRLGSAAVPSGGGSSPISVTLLNVLSGNPYVVTTEYYMSVDTSLFGAMTIQLPNSPVMGSVYIVKDSAGSSNISNITVTTVGGSVTIDGATSKVLNTSYASLTVVFNGTNYEIWQ